MGGNQFPNLNISRINREEYDSILQKLLLISDRFHEIRVPNEKETFGDIDIIYEIDSYQDIIQNNIDIFILPYFKTNELKNIMIELENGKNIHTKKLDNGLSYVYKGKNNKLYQLDVFFLVKNKINLYKFMYDYGYIYRLISLYMSIKMKNFTHTHSGLYYKVSSKMLKQYGYSGKVNKMIKFLVTDNIEEIFNIYGLNYKQYKIGFNSYDETFNWLNKSKISCNIKPLYFEYDLFFNGIYNKVESYPEITSESIESGILITYPHLLKDISEYILIQSHKDMLKDKFNVGIFRKHCNTNDHTIFLHIFEEFKIYKSINLSNTYIETNTNSKIEQDIKIFIEKYNIDKCSKLGKH